jgi:hypothetical protein
VAVPQQQQQEKQQDNQKENQKEKLAEPEKPEKPEQTHAQQPEQNKKAAADPDAPILPNLVVIGFQKAGTTYLRYLLASHPEMRTTCTRKEFKNEPSEVHFFDRLSQAKVQEHVGLGKNNSQQGIKQLRTEYEASLAEKCGAKVLKKPIAFDVTPGYSRLTPPAIRLMNMTVPPHTQFLALLRDPLELKKSRRVMHACIRGTAHNNCTLNDEIATDSTWTDHYATHLARWQAVVGKHRLHHVIFDRLVEEPLGVLNFALKLAGVAPMKELPDARKRPRSEEECKYKPCGNIEDAIIEHYNDPKVCNPLRDDARADLKALNETLGISVPPKWAKFCGGSHLPANEPDADHKLKTLPDEELSRKRPGKPQPRFVGYKQRPLDGDEALQSERQRIVIS